MAHSLFGGGTTSPENHNCCCYLVRVKNKNDSFSCNFKALDQDIICNYISAVKDGPWSQELKEVENELSDFKKDPIDILISADIAGKLFIRQKRDLKCGLVEVETSLGWTLMGKTNQPDSSRSTKTSTMLALSMLSLDRTTSVSQLWDLDILAIKDPVETESKKDIYSTWNALSRLCDVLLPDKVGQL